MSWEAIERAAQEWVVQATGLSPGNVYNAEQSGDRRPGDVVTIHLGDVIALGAVDEVQNFVDLSRPAGQELEQRVQGLREFTLTLQAYTASTVRDSTGRKLLADCQTALMLSSVRERFAAAGATPFDVGAVQNVTTLNGARFEGRAVLTVRFYTRVTLSEFSTFIESVRLRPFTGPPDEGTRDEIDI